ncbi:MAG: sulfatase-like hydrolase/transferase [Muribaculaceae bacterium]|nr:sulfatase-like hydrolase/transferase [Muribaculaceae bacterium]
MLLFSLSKKIGRTILFFLPIIILSGFQIVLLVLYGESIIAIDMYVNLLTTSASEAKELLGNLLGAISVIVILYLPLLVAAIIMYINKRYVGVKRRRHMRVASYVLLIIGTILFFITVLFTEGFMPRRELFPYNVAENLVTAIRRTNMSMHYHTTSREFNYSPVMTRDKDMPEVFVIVIGETSRAENWELFGYDRPTNPRLKQREGVYAFPKVLTEINTTHKAVPMLLSYLLPENFGDSVAYTKSIFSAFNNVGYRTAFLSNQKRNHSYLDNYGEEAQLAEFISDRGGTMRDINLIGAMNEIIDKSPSHKVFIVLHTYGSHFEYRKRYPSDMAYFTPDINSGATRFNREQLLNAYDNTIRYTDALLDGVIESLDNLDIPATMIFVSDHGEDIFDDERERFLHSSPTPTAHQIHVPMVIWLSKEFEDIHPDIVNALRNNKDKNIASTSSLFHTILDITGVRSPYYDATYSVASPKFTPRPRKYLNDYNESVPLTKSGIHQQDIEVFKKRNIDYE